MTHIETVTQTLSDNKGIDITTINVKTLTYLMDYIVICTGTSHRHSNALKDKVIEACKNSGMILKSVEGPENSGWLLIDLGEIIVHIMNAEEREWYNLEALWQIPSA